MSWNVTVASCFCRQDVRGDRPSQWSCGQRRVARRFVRFQRECRPAGCRKFRVCGRNTQTNERPRQSTAALQPLGGVLCRHTVEAGLTNVRTCSAEHEPPHCRRPHTCAENFMTSKLPVGENSEYVSGQTIVESMQYC